MMLNVDQDLRAEADFSGTLGARAGHDLVFGNPWAARNFEGDLTAFAIDLDPTLLPDPFAGLMAACDQPIL